MVEPGAETLSMASTMRASRENSSLGREQPSSCSMADFCCFHTPRAPSHCHPLYKAQPSALDPFAPSRARSDFCQVGRPAMAPDSPGLSNLTSSRWNCFENSMVPMAHARMACRTCHKRELVDHDPSKMHSLATSSAACDFELFHCASSLEICTHFPAASPSSRTFAA